MKSSNSQRVQNLLTEMTLDEKLAQIGSCWVYELQTKGELDPDKIASKLKHGIGQITRVAGASTLPPRSAARAANHLQKFLMEQTRLGIPAILHEECCCGAMVLGGTVFPQMLGLSATFQPELACEMTSTIRSQLRAIGARQALAPVLDIARDPRWGRVEETFGEDPILTSHFGVAYIKGLQGEGLNDGVLATGKHFIGHSYSQGGLNCGPVHMGWREIYDICIGPFQAAMRDAGLASIMNSYPDLDGEVVAASRRILTDILRNELGFEGLLVSDYGAVSMIHNFHFIAAGLPEAACLALEAGIDVELPTVNCYGEPLRQAFESGEICLETIDRAVSRHLAVKEELGLFEQPYVDEGLAAEVFDTNADRLLAREIARKSMVLLKNDGSLPLSKTLGSIAVIGPNAHDGRTLLGDYAYAAMKELVERRDGFEPPDVPFDTRPYEIQIPTILECIQRSVDSGKTVLYAKGCEHTGSDRSGFQEALDITRQADAVILVLGDRSGLVPECTCGETRDSADLRLPGMQEQLAIEVAGTGKPTIVVLVTGRPYAIPWLAEHVSAIVEAWLPGEEGGSAVAETLFGDANPGGKLPMTFPRGVGQVPIFYSSSASGTKSFWYDDYVNEKTTPLYPFGHGLSYTTFEYDDLQIDRQTAGKGESVIISLRLTNRGTIEGDEVVQLFTCDEYGCVPRPVKELKGFIRVGLKPGESRNIHFRLPVDQLAFYNNALELVLEPGKIKLMIGSSSEDIRLTGEFQVTGAQKMVIQDRVWYCPVDID